MPMRGQLQPEHWLLYSSATSCRAWRVARRPMPQPPPSERVATGGVAQSRVQRCRDVLVPGMGPGRRSGGGLLGGWPGRGQGTLGAPCGWNRPRLLLGKQLAPLPPSSPRPICAIASHPLIPAPEEARPCPPLACPHPPPARCLAQSWRVSPPPPGSTSPSGVASSPMVPVAPPKGGSGWAQGKQAGLTVRAVAWAAAWTPARGARPRPVAPTSQ